MSIPQIIKVVALSTAAIAFAGAAEAANFFFEGDMVRGRPQEGATGPTCVLSSQFKHLEHVVWRVRVLAADGQVADDKALKSLVVQVSDGQTFALNYGKHPRNPPQTDAFWATSWAIPADYPTGSLSYKVIATDLEGNAQEWTPFNINLSQLTVIPGEVTFTK
ncbi:MAG: hypothetical protein WD036_04425 [Bauldia sp.]